MTCHDQQNKSSSLKLSNTDSLIPVKLKPQDSQLKFSNQPPTPACHMLECAKNHKFSSDLNGTDFFSMATTRFVPEHNTEGLNVGETGFVTSERLLHRPDDEVAYLQLRLGSGTWFEARATF